MAPFNSQNTLFHYEAFWGLLLPITPTSRVCDIWRGYWVQRILWEIGAQLCFLPAHAIQERNIHNYLQDFIDEKDVYYKAGNLINFLINWQPRSEGLFDTIIELHTALIDANFFKSEELAFTQAWLEDLRTVEYQYKEIE
jgi:hypothetical protein